VERSLARAKFLTALALFAKGDAKAGLAVSFRTNSDAPDFLLTKILHEANSKAMPMTALTRINVFIGFAFITR